MGPVFSYVVTYEMLNRYWQIAYRADEANRANAGKNLASGPDWLEINFRFIEIGCRVANALANTRLKKPNRISYRKMSE